MIDIETLSLRPDAAIISVGVAIFDNAQVIAADSWAIDHRCWHGHLDPGTVQWWMQQSDEAVQFSFSGTKIDVEVALALKAYVMDHNCEEIWANDPNFDLVILESWWRRLNIEWPFKFWTYRAYKTLVAITQEITNIDYRSRQPKFTAHNPQEDAVAQARVVMACRESLRSLRR
jgi:exodeoxyribonuclease VIII